MVNQQRVQQQAVPSRFAAPNRPTPHTARHRVVSQYQAGASHAVVIPFALSKFIGSDSPVSQLKAIAHRLHATWPEGAAERMRTVGSRENHRGKFKDYVVSKTNNVLVIRAEHRAGTALEIFPNGRLVLGGKEVVGDCSERTRLRVASRLNAAFDVARATNAPPGDDEAQAQVAAVSAPAAQPSRAALELQPQAAQD